MVMSQKLHLTPMGRRCIGYMMWPLQRCLKSKSLFPMSTTRQKTSNLPGPGYTLSLFIDYPKSTGALHRSEEHTSELQSRENLVCCLLLEKKTLVVYHR